MPGVAWSMQAEGGLHIPLHSQAPVQLPESELPLQSSEQYPVGPVFDLISASDGWPSAVQVQASTSWQACPSVLSSHVPGFVQAAPSQVHLGRCGKGGWDGVVFVLVRVCV